ncbi:MAG TPA: 16S rRNA (uracil(1498)-N(3))-methyltransferase, partial [Myxococcota bacterium]|nr:16S rRNA (uracil(1498)-N(3))-methyltransferase [Myxococcota bacterium]
GPVDLSAAVADLPPARFLAEAGAPALASCAEAATLAIGPEGGFHPEEISFFQEAGFVPAGLGPHILRNPTAVAVGLGRLFTTAG